MLSCKDVTELISRSMDTSLPFGTRIGVRIHLMMCKFCARYKRQLLLIRETLRRLDAEEDQLAASGGESLSTEAREHIKNSLQSP